jgi:hypothetical protein
VFFKNNETKHQFITTTQNNIQSVSCFFVFFLVLKSSCTSIAKLRRKLQNISKRKVLFLDETALRLNEAPTSTLVAPGETEYVVVDDNTSYSKRFDMIACCSGAQVFPPVIYTPKERSDAGVRGINTKMLIIYIQTVLAQACGALDLYPLYLVLDRSRIHNEKEIIDAFHDNGCQELIQVLKMPTQAAKRMSPLDNSLFAEWKNRCRNREKITMKNIEQIMNDEWNNITSEHLYSYYRKCRLTRSADVYSDCPLPSVHKHNISKA